MIAAIYYYFYNRICENHEFSIVSMHKNIFITLNIGNINSCYKAL